jgi:integrase
VTDPVPKDLTEDEIALLRVWRTSTPEVRARLVEAVLKCSAHSSEVDGLSGCAAAKFLALTGLRRGEALSLRWPEIDLGVRGPRGSRTRKRARAFAPSLMLRAMCCGCFRSCARLSVI